MARFGLIGPSYSSQSLNADCQVTMNWYLEAIESSYGKSAMALYPCPGTNKFVTLPIGPIREQVEINGRTFAVSGPNFCEVLANGTYVVIGQVTNDGKPASMACSPQQLLLASGGNLYFYQLQTQVNTNGTLVPRGGAAPANLIAGLFQQIPNASFSLPSSGLPGNPIQVEYIDGFFLVLMKNSQVIYISTPLDASSWPPLQFIVVTVFSDNVQGIIEKNRDVYEAFD